jgi:autoinducer 2-degrading protein
LAFGVWFDCGGFCLPHNAISRQDVFLQKRGSKMLAVCVDFEVDPASLAAFLPLMQKNAAESLANEAGCHQFDITQDPQNLTKIFLYELYDDAAAFETHKQASHYLEFNEATSGMITAKSVRLLQKINH